MPGCPFPVCCSKPTISCQRIAGNYSGPGTFHYEITRAETAWITETCLDENDTEVVAVHPLELDESGNTSGDFASTSNCDYCVYAENESGVVSCCDQCDADPVCSISAELAAAACGTDSVVINWSYDAQGGPPIDEALINGTVSVLGNPDADSGTLTTTLASLGVAVTDSAFYDFELVIKVPCGESRCNASLFIYCLQSKSQLRATLDLADLNFECQFDLPTTDPEYRDYVFGGFTDFYVEYYQVHSTSSGMSGLNGTIHCNHKHPSRDWSQRPQAPAESQQKPSHWTPLHQYPVEHWEKWDAQAAASWFAGWRSRVPNYGCACQKNFAAYCDQNSLDFSSADAFFVWTVAAHNYVSLNHVQPRKLPMTVEAGRGNQDAVSIAKELDAARDGQLHPNSVRIGCGVCDAVNFFLHSAISGEFGPDDSRDGRSYAFLKNTHVIPRAVSIFMETLVVAPDGTVLNHDEAEQRAAEYISENCS